VNYDLGAVSFVSGSGSWELRKDFSGVERKSPRDESSAKKHPLRLNHLPQSLDVDTKRPLLYVPANK
jgi:hypothetical protein